MSAEKTVQLPRDRRGSWYYRMPFKRKMGLWGIIFLIPWIFGFFAFFFKPMIEVFIYSFQKVEIAPGTLLRTNVGFENFTFLFTKDATFNQQLVNALTEVLLYTPLVIIFSLLCAILLNGQFFGRTVARAIFFIPIVMATGLMMERVSNLSGQMVADSQEETVYGAGMIARMLFSLGIGKELVNYLLDAVNNIFEIVSLSGIQILIFLAALQGISPALYEVAKIEGATGYETFWKVTVVMVSPMILTCTVYTLADLFMRTDIMERIYDAFEGANKGLSAAMSSVYLLLNVLVIGLAAKLISKVVFYYD